MINEPLYRQLWQSELGPVETGTVAVLLPGILAGIMALSTYFATAESIEVNPVQNAIPTMICHGTMDPVVPESLGQKSMATLQSLGFAPEYHSYPMEHSLCPQQVGDIADWITRVLAGD